MLISLLSWSTAALLTLAQTHAIKPQASRRNALALAILFVNEFRSSPWQAWQDFSEAISINGINIKAELRFLQLHAMNTGWLWTEPDAHLGDSWGGGAGGKKQGWMNGGNTEKRKKDRHLKWALLLLGPGWMLLSFYVRGKQMAYWLARPGFSFVWKSSSQADAFRELSNMNGEVCDSLPMRKLPAWISVHIKSNEMASEASYLRDEGDTYPQVNLSKV